MPTISQSRSIAPHPTGWSGNVTLDQIDPSLGVTNLSLSLTGNLYSSAAIENLEASAANFSSTDHASVTLERPDGTAWLVAAPTAFLGGGRLGAYDGDVDGAGTSGELYQSPASNTVSVSYGPSPTANPDAGLLLGTGTVTLPAVASARVDAIAPGNFDAEFASDVAATVSTSATYGTGSPTSLGEDGLVVRNLTLVAPITAGLAADIQVRQQVVTIAEAATGTNGTVTLAGLDPSLGTLVGVDIDLLAYANGTAAVENLDPVAGILGISQAANIALTRIDGTSLVSAAAPGLSLSTILAGSDGHMDFAGASGADLALQAAAPPVRTSLTLSGGGSSVFAFKGTNDTLFTDANTLAAFTSPGNITLDANRSGITALSAPGNLAIDTTLLTGGAAIVTYLYTPAGP